MELPEKVRPPLPVGQYEDVIWESRRVKLKVSVREIRDLQGDSGKTIGIFRMYMIEFDKNSAIISAFRFKFMGKSPFPSKLTFFHIKFPTFSA